MEPKIESLRLGAVPKVHGTDASNGTIARDQPGGPRRVRCANEESDCLLDGQRSGSVGPFRSKGLGLAMIWVDFGNPWAESLDLGKSW